MRPDTPCLITFTQQDPGVTALESSSATPPVAYVAPPPNRAVPGVQQPPPRPSGNDPLPSHGTPTDAAPRSPPSAMLGAPRAQGSNPGPCPADHTHFPCATPFIANGSLAYPCCLPPTPWPGVTAADQLLPTHIAGFPSLGSSLTRPERRAPASPPQQRLRRVEAIQVDFPQATKRARR